MEEDFAERLEKEVGNLSTRLVTAVNKQVELEELVLQLRRQNSQLKELNSSYIENDKNYKVLLPKYNQLQTDCNISKDLKDKAEAENLKLKGEVEDLTASLFDEANTMVSNASRETHNFKIKNRKLYEEIEEKNIIINNLQEQLSDLKQMFISLEDQQKVLSTPKCETKNQFEFDTLSNTLADTKDTEQYDYQLKNLIYSPPISSIRFDLNNFNKDFKSFIYAIIKPEFILDLSHLKNQLYFKNIWTYEIENSILHVPALSSNNTIFNKWNKSKLFWNSLIEGKVQIEPIKGVNESFKLTYKGHTNNNTPVAIEESCSFCGESRNDNLEHCRLYFYKILDFDDKILSSYPLCNYCLIKLRNLCDFFAKIRLIKSNIFKLKQSDKFDDLGTNNVLNGNFSQFKRASTVQTDDSSSSSSQQLPATASSSELMNSSIHDVKLDDEEEGKLLKIYTILIQIRLKIFWSKIGYWDNEQVVEPHLDEINSQTFMSMITGKKNRDSFQQVNEENSETELTKEHIEKSEGEKPLEHDVEEVTERVKITGLTETKNEDPTNPPGVEESENQYFDTVEDTNDQINKEEKLEQLENKDEDQILSNDNENDGLKRSKSKQFTMKMNKDLDQTLEMLAENIGNK